MQITVASSRVRVVVMEVARRLPTQLFRGAMLIGVASFAFSLISIVGSKLEHIAFGDPLLSLNGDRSAPQPCEWVPFADAPACYASSAKKVTGKKKTVKVWKFIQRNTHGNGVLLLGESAIKYTFTDQNVSWISAAPTWNVCIINTKEKLGTMRPLSFALGRQSNQVEYGTSHDYSKSRLLFLNKPAVKIAYDVTSSDPVKEKMEMMYQTGTQRASSFSKVEQIFSDWIKVTPQAQQVLNGITRISRSKGVMLQETHFYPGGRKHIVLSTDSFMQCEVPASEFDYPTKFKTAFMKDIMQEHQKAREMSGVFEDLLFDPAPAKGAKKK